MRSYGFIVYNDFNGLGDFEIPNVSHFVSQMYPFLQNTMLPLYSNSGSTGRT